MTTPTDKGFFLTVEGIDGAGKTAAMETLVSRLTYHGYKVHRTREPGGSPLAEKIRALILHEKMGALTELLLFNASRSDHLDTTITDYLNQGYVVVSDRFSDSSYAYQGYGRGMPQEADDLEVMVVGNRVPNWTLYLKIGIDTSLKRLENRRVKGGQITDRLDLETLEFKRRCLAGFASREKEYVVIDAEQDIVAVASDLCNWIDTVFVPETNHILTKNK